MAIRSSSLRGESRGQTRSTVHRVAKRHDGKRLGSGTGSVLSQSNEGVSGEQSLVTYLYPSCKRHWDFEF